MSNKVFDALDKTFETVTKAEEVKTPVIAVDVADEALENDFQEARSTLKRAMAYSESAVQSALEVAQNSDNPRAYEVAIQAIKVMSDQAKDVMDVQKSKQAIDKIDGKTASKIENQTNIVFNGSTSDLLKAIKDEQNVIEHEPDDS
jgi:lipopolysaccharide biosynthesis regulator YciM